MTKYCNGSLVGFVTHLLVAERLQAVTSKKLLVKIQNPFVAFFLPPNSFLYFTYEEKSIKMVESY